MFNLDEALEDWIAEAVAAEPALAPHAPELADHVRAVVEDRTAEGLNREEAFAEALAALGEPSALGREFRKRGNLTSCLRSLAAGHRQAQRPLGRRAEFGLAAAWILLSLGWASVMFVVDNSEEWVIVAWLLTVYCPLVAIGLRLNRRQGPVSP